MKHIETVWEVKGKRRRLVGFDAYFDGAYIGRFAYHDQALKALDEIGYDDATHAGVHVLAAT